MQVWVSILQREAPRVPEECIPMVAALLVTLISHATISSADCVSILKALCLRSKHSGVANKDVPEASSAPEGASDPRAARQRRPTPITPPAVDTLGQERALGALGTSAKRQKLDNGDFVLKNKCFDPVNIMFHEINK